MSRTQSSFSDFVGPTCLAVGLALLISSFLWSRFDSGSANWTNEDAVALQQAANQAHELSFTVTGSSPASEKQALQEARDAHNRLNDQREAAIASANWRKMAIRWSGVCIAAVGILFQLKRREDSGAWS